MSCLVYYDSWNMGNVFSSCNWYLTNSRTQTRSSDLAPLINIFLARACMSSTTGASKLINSDLFMEKRATVPIKYY